MILPMLVVGFPLVVAGVMVYLAMRPEPDEAIEREVAKIHSEFAHGWDDERVLRHHRRFCPCQIRYLRSRAGVR